MNDDDSEKGVKLRQEEDNLLPSSKAAWERAREMLSEEPFDFKSKLKELNATLKKHRKELRAGETIDGYEWVDREFEHSLARLMEDLNSDVMETVE